MEFLNNKRHISGLLFLLAMLLFSCKKEEQHTSFYFDSASPYPQRTDEAQTQFTPNNIQVFRFTNNTPPFDVLSANGMPDELLWLRAQKSVDFAPINSTAPNDNSRTQMRLLYDNTALYIAIYCWDQNITFGNQAGGDLRNKADVVSIYIEPDGDNQNIYSIQVTPQNQYTDCLYPAAAVGTATLPTNYPGYIARSTQNYNQYNGIIGWFAEIKIPFSSTTPYNLAPPIPGTTSWRMNVIRQNYDSTGNALTFQGRYGWKDVQTLNENNTSAFYTISFNNNDISINPFPYTLNGRIMSAGPVNLSDCGFEGYINRQPFGTNITPINIPLGKKVNPGLLTTTVHVNVGDSISYNTYVIKPDGSKSLSYTKQQIFVR